MTIERSNPEIERLNTVYAASLMKDSFLNAPKILNDLTPGLEVRYDHLRLFRPQLFEYKIINNKRRVLAMAASYRGTEAMIDLLGTAGNDPLLASDQIEQRRQSNMEYHGKPERLLLGDEAVMRSLLFDLISPRVRPIFSRLNSYEQASFARTYGEITGSLMSLAQRLLEAEHPGAMRDTEFLADPLGKAGKTYSMGVRRLALAAFHKPIDPASQFFGPYEGGAELTTVVIGDAWNALKESGCPAPRRHPILIKSIKLLSLPAAMNHESFDKVFFADRYEPGRVNPFSSLVDTELDQWDLVAQHALLKSGALEQRPASCTGIDSLSPAGLSPVALMQALGLIVLRNISPDLNFLEQTHIASTQ